MRNINRMCRLGLGLILGTLLFPFVAVAQQPFPWEVNLESAQRKAAQSNRLVLIHFTAPWCGACNKMEAEVFSLPGVAAAVTANFVPVKINADQMPSIGQKYGITGLPSDVVITPQGQLIDKTTGRAEATQYVVRLNQIATARQPSSNQIAQVPAAIPARQPDRSIANQPPVTTRPAEKNTPADDRYADYYRRVQNDQQNQQPLNNEIASRETEQSSPATILPSPVAISPPYGQQQPSAAGPDLAGPNIGQSPLTAQPQVQDNPLSQTAISQQPIATTQPQQNMPNLSAPITANPSLQATANPAMQSAANPPQQNTPMPNQYAQPPVTNPNPSVAMTNNPLVPSPATSAMRQPVQNTNPTPSPTPGIPNLCMDGYSPVSLVEKGKWTPGDRRYGANHRGRVYLFTSEDEQNRFLKDPDRYAPVISGNDVIQAMEKGQTTPGKREHGVFFNGHIFLFADEAGLEKFSTNPAYYANQALEAIQANHSVQQMR